MADEPEVIRAASAELKRQLQILDEATKAPARIDALKALLFTWANNKPVVTAPLLPPEPVARAVVSPPPPADPAPIPAAPAALLIEAATLPPLTTERQMTVFKAMEQMHTSGLRMSAKTVAAESGVLNCLDVLTVLFHRGYIKRERQGSDPFEFYLLAYGEPRFQPLVEPTKKPGAEPMPINGDPQQGRSAFDRSAKIASLDIPGFLTKHGSVCRRLTSDTYYLDGKMVDLRAVLIAMNEHKQRRHEPLIDVDGYL